MTQAGSQATRWHLVYWFDEGSFIARASDDGQTSNVLFRIRECLLSRHSRCVLERQPVDGWDVPTLTMPPAQLGFHCAASFSLPAAGPRAYVLAHDGQEGTARRPTRESSLSKGGEWVVWMRSPESAIGPCTSPSLAKEVKVSSGHALHTLQSPPLAKEASAVVWTRFAAATWPTRN